MDLADDERKALRIYVIDDHSVVREAFIRAFSDEPDFEIVGQAATVTESLTGVVASDPDVVLVDMALPDGDGVDLVAAIRAAIPDAKILVVSAHEDEYRVAEALRAGANGYLLKSSTVADIAAGIRGCILGETPLSPTLAENVMRSLRKQNRPTLDAMESLTPREREVLRYFAMGLQTREIGIKLGISAKTVETHRNRVYDKLGARSIIDLARIAVRAGLIDA